MTVAVFALVCAVALLWSLPLAWSLLVLRTLEEDAP